MDFSAPKAKDSLDLDFNKWLQIHDEKQVKTFKLTEASKRVQDLSKIGRNMWFHFSRGDPNMDFQMDKKLMLEKQRFEQMSGKKFPDPQADAASLQSTAEAKVAAPKEQVLIGSFTPMRLQPPAHLHRPDRSLLGPVRIPRGQPRACPPGPAALGRSESLPSLSFQQEHEPSSISMVSAGGQGFCSAPQWPPDPRSYSSSAWRPNPLDQTPSDPGQIFPPTPFKPYTEIHGKSTMSPATLGLGSRYSETLRLG
eukprot:TRINITY_DN8167_c0_g1_i1.p1 TRINITY_DN8167_c0_g1~~TRINITY_DN8167_c0_g1_i1.p1  ORF type:complete len:253 (+),score=39.45 TRINITY_DN8167_c0_g1_i1:110-868(+)